MTKPKPPTAASRRKNPPKGPTTPPPAGTTRPASSAGAPPADRTRVVLAAVAGAHGVGGAVKLKLFTDDLGPYRVFNDGALTCTSLRGNVATFREVATRETAEALRGTVLTVARGDLPPLPEGEYYHADLIGLPAVTPDGADAGHVVAVENFGAGDVVEIERLDGRLVMVPMSPAAVPDWSPERLVVSPDYLDG